MAKTVDLKVLGTLVAMLVVAVVFWNWKFMYPIKVFVVLLHELGHGLAAVLTGGEIDNIQLSQNLGGVCWSRGGMRLVILPAGYLGSMLFGSLILVAAARTRYDRYISMVVGAIVVLVTAAFMRSMFGVIFGLIFGGAMILAGKFLSEKVNDIILKFLGLTSIMYAIIDIKEDLISRTVPGSDAYKMAEILLLPPVFWGILWILIAVVVSALMLWVASKGDGSDEGSPEADDDPTSLSLDK